MEPQHRTATDRARPLNEWVTKWTEVAFRFCTFPFVLFFLLVPSYEAMFRGNLGTAGVIAGVAAGAVLFTRLPDVIEFSFGSIRAKLVEAKREADFTVQQLRTLALAFAEAGLSDVASVGLTIVPIAMADKFRIRDQIVASLQAIDASEDEIARAQRHWIAIQCGIFAGTIAGHFGYLSGFRQPLPLGLVPNDRNLGVPRPETFRAEAERRNITDDALMEMLDEYQLLFTTGQMRKPELLEPLRTSPGAVEPG